MSSRTTATRAAALGTTVALATSLLVATTAASAVAADGATTYSCDFPVIGPQSVPVTGDIPSLPDTPAGTLIPAGSLDPSFVFDVTSVAGVLALVTDPSATGMALGLGEQAQAVPLSGFSFGTLAGTSLPASAASGDFTAPAAPGVYDVTMPEAFTFTGLLPGIPVPTPVSAACVTEAPGVLGTLTVLPEGGSAVIPSTTEAKLKKKRIRRGKRAKVMVTSIAGVDPLVQPATGEVVVRKGKRKVGTGTLEEGSVVIRTKRFKKPGRYKLKVTYLGDTLTSPSKDTVRVRVLKRKRRR